MADSIYVFDRYRDGIKKAEGAKITQANSPEEALEIAKRLFREYPDSEFRLVETVAPEPPTGEKNG